MFRTCLSQRRDRSPRIPDTKRQLPLYDKPWCAFIYCLLSRRQRVNLSDQRGQVANQCLIRFEHDTDVVYLCCI